MLFFTIFKIETKMQLEIYYQSKNVKNGMTRKDFIKIMGEGGTKFENEKGDVCYYYELDNDSISCVEVTIDKKSETVKRVEYKRKHHW